LDAKNIPFIEDAAQAHGSMIKEKYVGTFGRMGCFSTHDRKILPTGEGGFILTDNEADYSLIKSFIQFGYMKGKEFGLNYKLSALQAVLGMNRIKQILPQIRKRTKNAKTILDNISSAKIQELNIGLEGNPNYYSIVTRLNFSDNLRVINDLAFKGIPSDILRYSFEPMYKKSLFSSYASNCPNIEKLSKQITTIPCHPGLSEEQITYIIETINCMQKGEF